MNQLSIIRFLTCVAEPGGPTVVHPRDDVLHCADPALVPAAVLGLDALAGGGSAVTDRPPTEEKVPPGEDAGSAPTPSLRQAAALVLVQLLGPVAIIIRILDGGFLIVGGLDERRHAVRQPGVGEGGRQLGKK